MRTIVLAICLIVIMFQLSGISDRLGVIAEELASLSDSASAQ